MNDLCFTGSIDRIKSGNIINRFDALAYKLGLSRYFVVLFKEGKIEDDTGLVISMMKRKGINYCYTKEKIKAMQYEVLKLGDEADAVAVLGHIKDADEIHYLFQIGTWSGIIGRALNSIKPLEV